MKISSIKRKKLFTYFSLLAPLGLSIFAISSCKPKKSTSLENDNVVKDPNANGIRSIKMSVNNQQKVEIRIIVDDNYIIYDSKTTIEIKRISDNSIVDLSLFEIENKGNEIYLHSKKVITDFLEFISGRYKITINSSHTIENEFTRPTSTDTSSPQNPLEPDILYANALNKEDMSITIVGKNLSSIQKENISIKNSKSATIDFEIRRKNDGTEITVLLPKNLENDNYTIQIGKSSFTFSYKKVNEEPITPPSSSNPNETPSTPDSNQPNNPSNPDPYDPIIPNPNPEQIVKPSISKVELEMKLNKIVFKIFGQNLNLINRFKLSRLNSTDFTNLNPSSNNSTNITLEYNNSNLLTGTYSLEMFANDELVNKKEFTYTKPTLSSYQIIDSQRIKVFGQNLTILDDSNIKVEFNSSQHSNFSIESKASNSFVVKFNSSLVPNQLIKISITNSNYLEFQYNDVLLSSATMTKNNNDVIVEISGKNLNILENDLIKDYSNEKDSKKYSISLHNQTTGDTFNFYNYSKDTKYSFEGNKLKITVSRPKIGSGNFIVRLSHKGNIISTTSSIIWDVPYDITLVKEGDKAPRSISNGYHFKGQIYLWIEETVKNGFALDKHFQVFIEDGVEKVIYDGQAGKVKLVKSYFNYWNAYFQLSGANINFSDNFRRKTIRIYFKHVLIYSGFVSNYWT